MSCGSCKHFKLKLESGCCNNNEFCCRCGQIGVKCYHIYKPDNKLFKNRVDVILEELSGNTSHHSSSGKFCMSCVNGQLQWEIEYYREDYNYTGEIILHQISDSIMMICTKKLFDEIKEKGGI